MAIQPPNWGDGALEAARQAAISEFRDERVTEPLEEYLEAFDINRAAVEVLLETTVDLTEIDDHALEILTSPELLRAVRYLAGPPLSEDDLKTLADASLAPSVLHKTPDKAREIVEIVIMALDRRRFPWIHENREPDEREREAAAIASAALLAAQHVSTLRRNTGKTRQEKAVADALIAHGFTAVGTRTVNTLSEAPAPGEFCGESMFGGRKADFVIGLWDHRTMPLECKVSNSAINSIKRLNNDAAVKAVEWIKTFGTAGVVPAAMLSGVYDLHNLKYAQDRGLALFWAHSLSDFIDWIASTAPS